MIIRTMTAAFALAVIIQATDEFYVPHNPTVVTMEHIPIPKPNPKRLPKIVASERYCLAKAMWFEARGEPIDGQIAVANVILNRLEDNKRPKTICGVVHQGCQFSWNCDPAIKDIRPEKINQKTWSEVFSLATAILITHKNNLLIDVTGGAEYFFNYEVHHYRPQWAKLYVKTAHVGNHEFYKRPND